MLRSPNTPLILPLVRMASVAYHGRRSVVGGGRPLVRRLRMVRSGVTMTADDSPLTRASLLVQLRECKPRRLARVHEALWPGRVWVRPQTRSAGRRRGRLDAGRHAFRVDRDWPPRLRSQPGNVRGRPSTIMRNKVFSFLSARRIRPQGSGDTTTNRLLAAQPDTSDGADVWEMEYQRRLASLAMDRVKSEFQDTTWRAFVASIRHC